HADARLVLARALLVGDPERRDLGLAVLLVRLARLVDGARGGGRDVLLDDVALDRDRLRGHVLVVVAAAQLVRGARDRERVAGFDRRRVQRRRRRQVRLAAGPG